MSFFGKNIVDLREADIMELIDTGVPEGPMIEYKRDNYGRSDADVKEFLKDVSSFANSSGGNLVIGIDEAQGIASAISPLQGLDADAEIQRVQNLIRDGIEPRIVGIAAISVAVQNGHVIVIRVPKSWNPPHRVSARGTNRFYGRTSAGAYELSVDELRVSFSAGATIRDRILRHRLERLGIIDSHSGLISVRSGACQLILHIVPFSAMDSHSFCDLERAFELHNHLRPLGEDVGYSPNINFDGYVITTNGDEPLAYTQLFRDGVIEAVIGSVAFNEGDLVRMPITPVESYIQKRLPKYISALQQLELSPPFAVLLGFQRLNGVRLYGVPRGSAFADQSNPLRVNSFELPPITINDFGEPAVYQSAMKPAFDALWNGVGRTRSPHFNEDGQWNIPL